MKNIKYDIRINFNSFECWYNELKKYLKTINFGSYVSGDILYYPSDSFQTCYNFKIILINHELKIVELKAINK